MNAIEPYLVTPCCVNCHFLMKWDRDLSSLQGNPSAPQELKDFVTAQERGALRKDGGLEAFGNEDGRIGSYNLACYQNVWDSANFRKDSPRDIRIIVTRNRGESCFFYPYTPGMFFPAAAELERREADRREAKRDRGLTKWSIILGIIAALVGAAIGSILTAILS